ncbi:response regulator transcription factor [Amorphus orientalis]|uniref:FixJ family two-component response regulator n=1 Tax=Amorphus orientalis TaxID=649198 RepID=A0AAE3VNH3_9HYPH|nr:response regulator [Amorphus orientalis]MDQ0315302.1 FixJ family two-component response regulator [Amorphus orientalis]
MTLSFSADLEPMSETAGDSLVYVVDDDSAVREALVDLLQVDGFQVEAFADGASFVSRAQQRPACALIDVHMPGSSGLDILKLLRAEVYPEPIFMMSGQADIQMAVSAIKDGAFDFLEKPFDADYALTRIHEAFETRAERLLAEDAISNSFHAAGWLTPQERQVLSEVASGASNVEAGRRLGISLRTIAIHRARIMEKLGARNTADLIRIVLTGRLNGA